MDKHDQLKNLLIELKYITQEQLDSFKQLKNFASSIDDEDYVIDLKKAVEAIYNSLTDFEQDLGYRLIYNIITD